MVTLNYVPIDPAAVAETALKVNTNWSSYGPTPNIADEPAIIKLDSDIELDANVWTTAIHIYTGDEVFDVADEENWKRGETFEIRVLAADRATCRAYGLSVRKIISTCSATGIFYRFVRGKYFFSKGPPHHFLYVLTIKAEEQEYRSVNT
jgi:hypothetical protein